jgi:hypothetical protein
MAWRLKSGLCFEINQISVTRKPSVLASTAKTRPATVSVRVVMTNSPDAFCAAVQHLEDN